MKSKKKRSHGLSLPVTLTCKVCGKAFTATRSKYQRKTCSQECFANIRGRSRIIWRTSTCAICGKVIKVKSSETGGRGFKRTCSKECHTELRKIISRNKPPLSEEMKQILAEKNRRNPRIGHFPTNVNAKEYSFKSPEGRVYRCRNLHYFANKRRTLFAGIFKELDDAAVRRIRGGLVSIVPWRRHAAYSWYGWTWYDGGEPTRFPFEYSLKSPQGKVFKFILLHRFVTGHRELFTEIYKGVENVNPRRISCGFSTLAPWSKCRRKSWHGWTWHDG